MPPIPAMRRRKLQRMQRESVQEGLPPPRPRAEHTRRQFQEPTCQKSRTGQFATERKAVELNRDWQETETRLALHEEVELGSDVRARKRGAQAPAGVR